MFSTLPSGRCQARKNCPRTSLVEQRFRQRQTTAMCVELFGASDGICPCARFGVWRTAEPSLVFRVATNALVLVTKDVAMSRAAPKHFTCRALPCAAVSAFYVQELAGRNAAAPLQVTVGTQGHAQLYVLAYRVPCAAVAGRRQSHVGAAVTPATRGGQPLRASRVCDFHFVPPGARGVGCDLVAATTSGWWFGKSCDEDGRGLASCSAANTSSASKICFLPRGRRASTLGVKG